MAYYDVQKGKYITDEEQKKMNAEEPYFSEFPKLSKCQVCEYERSCNKKEKFKNGCKEFELNEMSEWAEVYRKQNK